MAAFITLAYAAMLIPGARPKAATEWQSQNIPFFAGRIGPYSHAAKGNFPVTTKVL
ncbi:hypothetical protein [Primorskyibacter sp. 2E233]|uniref:hypothetical protein n=1 Tax=Primorskyibacter sp. 2E233 TaxID=3413431 RepID=UPI003BF168C7